MKFMPEDIGSCKTQFDRVVLLFGNETVTIERITDYEIDCVKFGESTFSITFAGMISKLLQMQDKKKHLDYIKLIGRATEFDQQGPGSITQTFVLNVSCDMRIDTLHMSQGVDDPLVTEVAFSGDMW